MAYTTIDDPSAHFQTALYSSDSSSVTVTNGGNSDLQPDWIWIKVRNGTNNHNTFDTSRGVANRLKPDTDDDEDGSSGVSVSSDGFATGTSLGDINNTSGSNNYVAWQWKANGGTRTTNTESGDNPAGGYQANTTAGFSIIDYTGTGATGTMAHGLGAVPHMIFFKTRATGNWNVYHKSITADKYLLLSTTAAETDDNSRFNDTEPTSTVFTLDTAADVNGDGTNYIAYAFAPIQGYSKFGSYTGNGNADGTFVYTGFKPAWLMIKKSSGTEGWHILDYKRDVNENNTRLQAEVSNAEDTSEDGLDMLSNGFKIRTTWGGHNTSGGTYVYMAFAEHPFVSSEGVPCTAR